MLTNFLSTKYIKVLKAKENQSQNAYALEFHNLKVIHGFMQLPLSSVSNLESL